MHAMNTCNSPPQHQDSLPVPLSLENAAKAHWDLADEIAFWNSAAALIKVHSATGGPSSGMLSQVGLGFSWDNENGLNINIKQISAWNEYVVKNKDAKPFKTKGFPHFNHIQAIMPSTVRGVHAFHPSQQSFGAIANAPYSGPSNALGEGQMPPTTTSKPNRLTTLSSLLVLAAAVPSGKPDSSNEDVNIPPTTPMCPSSHSMTVLPALSEQLQAAYTLDHMANNSATLPPMVHWHFMASRSSAECRIKATALLQNTETLTAEQAIGFADLFEQNTAQADTYIALVHPDVWKLWVQKQLEQMGFPAASSATEA
ncbi:hypothetical protein BYT27DRAFT_7258539 [Phlegmacium glaucopus]|nr:hypothetical protein BYT27DRAFT_7258539 [Phlegmacium glaucopus]